MSVSREFPSSLPATILSTGEELAGQFASNLVICACRGIICGVNSLNIVSPCRVSAVNLGYSAHLRFNGTVRAYPFRNAVASRFRFAACVLAFARRHANAKPQAANREVIFRPLPNLVPPFWRSIDAVILFPSPAKAPRVAKKTRAEFALHRAAGGPDRPRHGGRRDQPLR